MPQSTSIASVLLAATTAAALLGCAGSGKREGGSPSDTATVTGAGDPGAVEPDASPVEQVGEFGTEQSHELRLNDDPPPLTLELDRADVAALFGDRAGEVQLLDVDATALLRESLERIKNACGSSWQEDNPNPRHDCSSTELGTTFAGPDGTWQTSAEYALVRILTMTPANVVVDGTSSASLRSLADALGIGGGYSQLISDALGIARTAPVVSTAGLAESLRANFVATHPNIGPGGNLVITLEEALSDLATLTARYGPMGAHPGVLDPSFSPSGRVLGDAFSLRAVAASNLRLCDGIDGESGKGFLSVLTDEVGPTFADELEFDFQDPERFGITGLVEDLTVDLRLAIFETGQFVPSCSSAACQANAPGMPVGNASVWAVDPWLFEYNVAAGARNDYIDRTFNGSYLFGLARVSLGQGGTPPGWIAYDVPLNLGNPPADQFVWETVLEVAQVALHQTPFANIAEGEANVAFTLHDVPVGLTGSEVAQKVRPYLEEQGSVLSDLLLGDYEKNNDAVDFYYCRAAGGTPLLFFVDEADMKDGQAYAYQHPGFFRSSTLEGKLSSADIPGLSDTSHEKLKIEEGETTFYFEDEHATIYRARVVRAAGSDELEIHLAPQLTPPRVR
jgi:hypothetical protein